MLQHSIRDYISLHAKPRKFFFDRGIPDILGYTKLINAAQDDIYLECAKEFRYNKTVFIFPPWEGIYKNDTERKQDFREAIKTYHVMKDVYNQLEYQVVEVPKTTIADRVNFILNYIA